jgi:hypothetical protein
MPIVKVICTNTQDHIFIDDTLFEKIRIWIAYQTFFDFGVRYEKFRAIEYVNLPEAEKTKLYNEFYAKTDDMVFSGLITDGIIYFCISPIKHGHTDNETCSDIYSVYKRQKDELSDVLKENIDTTNAFFNIIKDCVKNNSELRWELCPNSIV